MFSPKLMAAAKAQTIRQTKQTKPAKTSPPSINAASILVVALVLCGVSIVLSAKNQLPGQEQGPRNSQCSASEFTCSNKRCVPLNKYCDSVNNCLDNSDEPRFCTRCNRTYYGNVGLTYDLDLHRPKEDKLPYICVLTFTAAGGVNGDIVQITLNSFTLGKFVSYTHNGCQDGYLQIAEASRLPVGGMFCGSSWGPAVFYSETRSLILTVKLFKLSRDQNDYNFDFRMQYKTLSRDQAVVRYGGIKHEVLFPWINVTSNYPQFNDYINSSIVAKSPGKTSQTNSNSEYASNPNNDFNVRNVDILANAERENEARNMFNRERFDMRNSSYHYATKNKSSRKLEKQINYTEPKYYLGDLIPGTYCSKIFSNCDKKACRIQSPNFPGIYPRNLTCYYAIRQHDVPQGKHALITVGQPKGNLVWITTQTTANTLVTNKNDKEKFKPKLHVWDQCNNDISPTPTKWKSTDQIQIYDGYTTRDPILLKFCGGSQSVPPSTSSGPELLVEFATSPFGTFMNPQQYYSSLNGFQLEVNVQFVDILSPTYARSKRLCEFWVRGTGHGELENPKHSLAPNTTCLYHLQGTEALPRNLDQLQVPLRRPGNTNSRFKIWISIIKFDYAPKFELIDEVTALQQTQEDCSGMLRIFDGQLREVPICKDLDCLVNEREMPQRLLRLGQNHTNVLARFCRGSVPRTCDHGITNETDSRPCTFSESFISSSDYVTLELKTSDSTVLRPLNFKIRYEFVDYIQDGVPIEQGEHGCNRKFTSSMVESRTEPVPFRGVRNVFYFGRGGAKDLKCIYRFQGQRDERVRIVIKSMMAGNRSCESKIDQDIDRTFCFGDNSAKLEILEHPWVDSVPFIRSCVCNSSSNASSLPYVYISTGREIELHFSAINMTNYDAPETLNFEGTFEFFKAPSNCRDLQRKTGSFGVVNMNTGDTDCQNRPYLIEPSAGKYIYVRFRGHYLSRYNPQIKLPLNTSIESVTPDRCETKSRIVITSGEGVTIIACPLPTSDYGRRHVVEVFSSGWHKPIFMQRELSPVLSMELLLHPDDYEYYSFTWMELERRPPVVEGIEDCEFHCPELQACVNASVRCDSVMHCPSGYDESFRHCSAILRLPGEILASISVVLFVLCCGLVTYIYKKIKRHCRRSSVLQTRLKSMSSMDTSVCFDEKDFIS